MNQTPDNHSSRIRHIPVEGRGSHPLRVLQHEIGQVLDAMYEKIGKHHHSVSGHVAEGFAPETDLGDTKAGFHLAMDLPGVEEGDVEILVTDERLIVQGEKKSDREVSEPTYYLRERAYGRFRRAFRLPPGLDAEEATARFEKGVLFVDVPRAPGSQEANRRIPIKSY